MKYIKISFLLLAFLLSCKKKNDEPAPTNVSTQANGSYGNLQSSYYIYDYGNNLITMDSMVIASFFSDPATVTAPTNIYAGIVSANGTILKYQTPYNIYTDTTHTINIRQMTFSAAGSGTVTPFTYSYTPVYPQFSTPVVLNDTCIKSNGITVNIPAVSNVNASIEVSIYQGTTTHTTKYISATSGGSVTFTASDLNAFIGNYPITIGVFLYNLESPANVGSVNYGVTSTLNYQRFCYLKN